MAASKRKNETSDVATKSLVIVGNNSRDNDDETGHHRLPLTTHTAFRMKQLRSTLERSLDDDVTDSIAQAIYQALEVDARKVGSYEKGLVQEAHKIQTMLSEQIKQAKDRCDQESVVLADLSSQLAKLQKKRHELLTAIDNLDECQRISQGKIAMFQEEVSQELDLINQVEEEKKHQVPRLKTTISLYASATGIKWDFAHAELLSGQVAVPCKQGFKLFSIDPRDFSGVETADHLWNLIEGNEK